MAQKHEKITVGIREKGGRMKSVEEECRMGMGRWDEIESDMKQEKLKRGSFESDAMWDEGFRRRESTRDRF